MNTKERSKTLKIADDFGIFIGVWFWTTIITFVLFPILMFAWFMVLNAFAGEQNDVTLFEQLWALPGLLGATYLGALILLTSSLPLALLVGVLVFGLLYLPLLRRYGRNSAAGVAVPVSAGLAGFTCAALRVDSSAPFVRWDNVFAESLAVYIGLFAMGVSILVTRRLWSAGDAND